MSSQALLHQAVSLHQQGRFAEADALYRQMLAQTPDDFQAQYRLAHSLFQQQRAAEALAEVTAALALNPEAANALVLKGALLAAAGARDDALIHFERAIISKPDFASALYNRALIQLELGRFAEALTGFDHLLTLFPDLPEAWTNRGAALQGLGRLPEALADYNRAVTVAPDYVPAWLNRGTVLQSLGRFDQALQSFDKVLTFAPRHIGALRGRGGALAGLERFDEALVSLDDALEITPGDSGILKQRTSVQTAAQQFATPSAKPEQRPEQRDVWYKRAEMFHVTQRLTDALAALDKVLAIAPDYPPALTLKGTILCEARRVPEGLEVYRRHAEIVFGGEPVGNANDPPYKQRHDAEQRAYLSALGIQGDSFHLEPGARIAGPAVNPVNVRDAAARWRESKPQIAVIDNLLTEAALNGLRRFCWGSTMWRRAHPKGYLGAVPEQGFACPLLAQIADELCEVFPSVIGGHGLRLMWGFKYDSSLSGIPMHADQAAVNVNFWITPDEANRDPGSGGLVVWDVKAPQDWDFDRYNRDEAAIRTFLAERGAKPITIPYRANRAVIFDSDLFHETDRIAFQDGYQNRRLNVTMLYGRRTSHGG